MSKLSRTSSWHIGVAAEAVIKRKGAINGRAFWYIRNGGGDWVRLMECKA